MRLLNLLVWYVGCFFVLVLMLATTCVGLSFILWLVVLRLFLLPVVGLVGLLLNSVVISLLLDVCLLLVLIS